MSDYVLAIENAFRLYGQGEIKMPPKVYLDFPKGDLRCMPAYMPSMNIAGVKNVNVHPGNRELSVVMATITLIDPDTGFPLAIMDGTYITKMRTGAAGAVAAKYLSREDSRTATFVGAGTQAQTQLEGLMITRPSINKVIVYDVNESNMRQFAESCKERYSVNAVCAASIEDAVREADILVTTTPVRNPIIRAEYVQSGTHINAIGADAKGKQELYPEVLKKARIVIDNWEQASHSGEINVVFSNGIISREDIYADIGEIVTGKKPGRESPEQVTVFDSTGLAIQDICSAYEIYNKLVSDGKLESQMGKINFIE